MPKPLGTFYVLVRRGHNGRGQPVCSVMVKTSQYFIDQGGLIEEWGKHWQLIKAEDIDHARELGAELP